MTKKTMRMRKKRTNKYVHSHFFHLFFLFWRAIVNTHTSINERRQWKKKHYLELLLGDNTFQLFDFVFALFVAFFTPFTPPS